MRVNALRTKRESAGWSMMYLPQDKLTSGGAFLRELLTSARLPRSRRASHHVVGSCLLRWPIQHTDCHRSTDRGGGVGNSAIRSLGVAIEAARLFGVMTLVVSRPAERLTPA
jgi:hypothetical protein